MRQITCVLPECDPDELNSLTVLRIILPRAYRPNESETTDELKKIVFINKVYVPLNGILCEAIERNNYF